METEVVENRLKIQKLKADKIPQPSDHLKATWVFPKHPRNASSSQ